MIQEQGQIVRFKNMADGSIRVEADFDFTDKEQRSEFVKQISMLQFEDTIFTIATLEELSKISTEL